MIATVSFLILSLNSYAQEEPFTISINPIDIDGLPGIQSYAFGQAEGKWVVLGGRLDGLHKPQPFAAFDLAGHNNQIYVVDPVARQIWSSGLSSLPVTIAEQLSSTNMEFYQEGNYLYCLGGYGYSATEGNHTTYDKLTAIDVPGLIDAIQNGRSISTYFRQITDSQFQVTGGKLKKIYNTYYLLGGQKFIGLYNPMGPEMGPGFSQEYTNSVRRFKLNDDGESITVTHLESLIDSTNLHRRDYNAEPQIMPNLDQGITMFSGVFQYNRDLPFLNCVNLDSSSYIVNNDFQQYFNHYHCPAIPIFSEQENQMHTLFFGGIAQFYEEDGILVQDDNVPFVRTIARVTREQNGDMNEYRLPLEMPGLLGASAEFIPNLNLAHYPNKVFKLDELPTDTSLLGYIFGGIHSSALNIFLPNQGTQSSASNTIYQIKIGGRHDLSSVGPGLLEETGLRVVIYPNPSNGELNIDYFLAEEGDVQFTVTDVSGRILKDIKITGQNSGTNTTTFRLDNQNWNGVYFLTIRTKNFETTRKIISQK
jgi:hypothetical protein